MNKRASVTLIDAQQLRQLRQDSPEGDVLLVDVREPAEYQAGHIPGAQLIPLLQLKERVNDLRPGIHTVFYCNSGQRSLRAAAALVMARNLPYVYNLEGGIIGWDGEKLPDLPNLLVFDAAGTLEEVISRAMEMEKGAMRLYESFLAQFVGTVLEAPLLELVSAELAHVRSLFRLLEGRQGAEAPRFEEVYSGMKGDILESGEELQEVVARMAVVADSGPVTLMELALELELRAYDLYSKMAHREPDPDVRQVFKELATQEKRHARPGLAGPGVVETTPPRPLGYNRGPYGTTHPRCIQ